MATEDFKRIYEDVLSLYTKRVKPVLIALFLDVVKSSSAKGCIDTFLRYFDKHILMLKKINLISSSNYTILFPTDRHTDIRQWDIPLLCTILLSLGTLEGKLLYILNDLLLDDAVTVNESFTKEQRATKPIEFSKKVEHVLYTLLPSGNQSTDSINWDVEFCTNVLLHNKDRMEFIPLLQSFIMREMYLFAHEHLDDLLRYKQSEIDILRDSKQITLTEYDKLCPPKDGKSNILEWDNNLLCIVAINTCKIFTPNVVDSLYILQSMRKNIVVKHHTSNVDERTQLYKAIQTIDSAVPHTKQEMEQVQTSTSSKGVTSKTEEFGPTVTVPNYETIYVHDKRKYSPLHLNSGKTKDIKEIPPALPPRKTNKQQDVHDPGLHRCRMKSNFVNPKRNSNDSRVYAEPDESTTTARRSRPELKQDKPEIEYISRSVKQERIYDTISDTDGDDNPKLNSPLTPRRVIIRKGPYTEARSSRVYDYVDIGDNSASLRKGPYTEAKSSRVYNYVDNGDNSASRPYTEARSGNVYDYVDNGDNSASRPYTEARSGNVYDYVDNGDNSASRFKDETVRTFTKRELVTDNESLHRMCVRHGRKSPEVKEICDGVCKDIRSCSSLYKHVLAAYKPYRDNKIVFVVFTEKCSNRPARLQPPLDTFNVVFRESGVYSDENEKVMRHLSEKELSFTKYNQNKVENVLQSMSLTLMEKHQNLNIVSACPIKSINYGTDNESVLRQTCIVLYVEIKGLIPIQEEVFPKWVKGFQTDVREGGFELYGPKANEYNPKLKMGCLIGSPVDAQNNFKGGTLGAFVDLPGGHVGCITSAHVVLNDIDMKYLVDNKFIENRDSKILQPVPYLGPHFGHITKAVYSDGRGDGETGVEAAFILITDKARLPESGDFPDGVFADTGFSPSDPMLYTSGKIYTSISDELRQSTVYKYGSETLLTRGVFDLYGPSVRTGTISSRNNKYGICLHKQVQMLKVGKTQFATHGDSGALVLVAHKGDKHDLRAIGIVTGGLTDGTLYFVTPIWCILKALGLSCGHKLKEFTDSNIALPCGMETDEAMGQIEERFQDLYLYGRSGTATGENHPTNEGIFKVFDMNMSQLRQEMNDFKGEVRFEQAGLKTDIKKQFENVNKTIEDKFDLLLNHITKK